VHIIYAKNFHELGLLESFQAVFGHSVFVVHNILSATHKQAEILLSINGSIFAVCSICREKHKSNDFL
jgi:hypothetical protein